MSTKILIISEKFWPEGGGGELATKLIVDFLAKNEVRVKVVTGTENPELTSNAYIYKPQLDVGNKIALWTNLLLPSGKSEFRCLLSWANIVYIPGYCYPLITQGKEETNKVIVHLHDYQPISFSSTFLYDTNGNKLFDSLRDSIRVEILKNESPVRAFLSSILHPLHRLARSWISEADKLVCVSEKQQEILKKSLFGIENRKMKIIRNPLPPVTKNNNSKLDTHFLYTGGDNPLKGIRTVASAMRDLSSEYDFNSVLVKINKKEWKMYFRKLEERYGNNFKVYSRLGYERLSKIRSKAMSLIFPSLLNEPSPFSIVEAMLSGTIPIASRVGGVPELVKGTYAEKMLFPPGNHKELKNRMKRIMELPESEIKEIGQDLRLEIKRNLDQEENKKKLLRLFSLRHENESLFCGK